MRYANKDEMREIDDALAKHIRPYRWLSQQESLLARAAAGVSNFVMEMCAQDAEKPEVFVVYGKGNNGADAIIAGLNLRDRGFNVSFFAAMPDCAESPVIKNIRRHLGRESIEWQNEDEGWCAYPPRYIRRGSVVIDGVVGIGVSGTPEGETQKAIRWINSLKGRAKIVSVDLPSGLEPNYGEPAGWDSADVVNADYTICMGLPKLGMDCHGALRFTGSIYVNDLEIDETLIHKSDSDELVAERDVAALLAPRRWDMHKGEYGHVAIVGGAVGYSGAPFIAALGAARAGAGLVSVIAPEDALLFAPTIPSEYMVRPLRGPVVTAEGLRNCGFDFKGKTVVVGPGFSRFDGAADAVLWLANESGAKSIVIDADALGAFAGSSGSLARIAIPRILTPHPGEAAALLGTAIENVQSDRRLALMNLVAATESAVILKGAGTLVSAPGEGFHLIACVNPGMAKGGMGDFLAGVCGAYLARGLNASAAARAAAWKHAAAADRAAWRFGHDTMQANDLYLE